MEARLEFYRPSSWREALEIKAAHPEAVPIFGGTDMMVDLNFDRERPEAMMDLTRVPEISGVGRGGTAACAWAPG